MNILMKEIKTGRILTLKEVKNELGRNYLNDDTYDIEVTK